jgi:mono/diheme cytochrome c family protein
MKRIAASVLFAALLIAAGRADAQDAEARGKGRAIAERVCSECHEIGKSQFRSPNGQAPTFGTIATTPGMTGIALTAALRTSHRNMPNIILNDDETRGIVAYILSLQ